MFSLRREATFENVKFVMTRGELGYDEVLKDFINAKFIYIVTYNISKGNETLLKELKKVSDNSEVHVYTNIPSRFDNYYYGSSLNTAKSMIDLYINKLNPSNFTENFSSYFSFNNHSKIIMTDNIAYIGSANYSSESARNIESGIIIDNSQDILKLKAIIIEEIRDNAESYYEYDNFPLIFLARELEEIKTILSENLWGVWEVHGIERGQYYRRGNINMDINIMEVFERFQVELDRGVVKLIQEIEHNSTDKELPSIEESIVEELDEINHLVQEYEVDQDIIEFLEFNEEDYIYKLMQENFINMTEEVLDEYVHRFTDQAFQIKTDLANNAENGFNDFELFLTSINESLMKIVTELRSIINREIDNT